MISARLLIYVGSLAACVAVCAYIWFAGIEHGRNEVLAEQRALQAEAQEDQDIKDEETRTKDVSADKALSVDLSDVDDFYLALETEVPHVEPESTLQDDNARADCRFGDSFIGVLRRGARGPEGSSEAASDSGDGRVPPDASGTSR